MEEIGWAWFTPLQEKEVEEEISQIFAKLFSRPEGQQVLDHLYRMTLGRALSPQMSDAMLRHLEGQRALVLYIASLVHRS